MRGSGQARRATTMTLLLSKEDVRRCLSMGEIINKMEAAFLAFHHGGVTMPQRLRIAVGEGSGYGAFMPCAVTDLKGFGIKLNTNFKQNPVSRDLPAILGLIVLFDIQSGEPLAIMDSTLITAYRTAAVSGVAARYLARDNIGTVGVLGSGVQSSVHIQAMVEETDCNRVVVYSPSLAAKSSEFLNSVKHLVDTPVEVADSAEEVVRQAQILVVCTDSEDPVLDGRWIPEGTLVIAVGNARPDRRELDTITVKRSKIVCDSRQACLVEAGDLLIPIEEGSISGDDVSLDLAHVIQDRTRGRQRRDEIILFKSVGLAFEDIVAASHVYRRASANGDVSRFDFFALGSPQNAEC